MTRTNPYPMNDPRDFSMLTRPKLKINDTVIVWDKEEGGKWVQARVVDATFNRGKKCWEYSAVVEFMDEEEHREHSDGDHKIHEDGIRMIFDCNHVYKTKSIVIKDWYCFSDDELKKPLIEEFYTETVGEGFYQYEQKNVRDITLDMYIVIKE